MVKPGFIQLTLVLYFFLKSSKAKLFVNPLTADFELAYPIRSEKGFSPTIEPILTIEFLFSFLIFFKKYWLIINTEIKFIFSILLISCLVKSKKDFLCL